MNVILYHHKMLEQFSVIVPHTGALAQGNHQHISLCRVRVEVIRTGKLETGVHPSQCPCAISHLRTAENAPSSDLFPAIPGRLRVRAVCSRTTSTVSDNNRYKVERTMYEARVGLVDTQWKVVDGLFLLPHVPFAIHVHRAVHLFLFFSLCRTGIAL